ncbi:MAG TPA: hypothetical protein VFF35_11190, partial [Bacteroidia bacterium]|nr:hypothetical protein [Bacteroidia bacterium]
LLSITFRAGGQKRCKSAPPAGMQETFFLLFLGICTAQRLSKTPLSRETKVINPFQKLGLVLCHEALTLYPGFSFAPTGDSLAPTGQVNFRVFL